MISIIQHGVYKLIETKGQTKILYLDDETYAWVEPANIGEILVHSHNTHRTDCILSIGSYYIYNIADESELSGQQHIELETGNKSWQGYLLLTGLPTDKKIRGRIIPTTEVITGNFKISSDDELK
jgi:hypothetical protein